ncbi:MAG: NACHT domain-containing protein [Anaerolineae bacterium]
MNNDLLQRLSNAETDSARQAIVLEMSIGLLAPTVKQAVFAAAVPHWFDFNYLAALIGEDDCDEVYDELLENSFINHIPGRGYAIHERTRKLLLDDLWQRDEPEFLLLSKKAADYCLAQEDKEQWQAEEVYHRLISDPTEGLARFQQVATAWANFEHNSYEDIERMARYADEQIISGRLSGEGAAWTHLWQARLNLIYGKTGAASQALAKISQNNLTTPKFAAEVANSQGDILAAQGDSVGMEVAWQKAVSLYDQHEQKLDIFLVQEKLRSHGISADSLTDDKSKSSNLKTESAKIKPAGADVMDGLRNQLLDNIESGWVNGVLRKEMSAENRILDLQLAKGEHSQIKVHRPGSIDQSLNNSKGLKGLFQASGRSLLILGAPGSGKTITLLQLLDELIHEARLIEQEPIPLLLNLSSFGGFTGSFEDWVAEQAFTQYSLSRNLTLERLKLGDHFTLLLDGLDEVSNTQGQREKTVQAINAFAANFSCGIAICSRITDYHSLKHTLAVGHLVVLQPLSNQQITQTLEKNENQTLLQLAKQDWRLREALRSPLLLKLFPIAVAGKEASLSDKQIDSISGWRSEIFAQYADQVLPTDQRPKHRSWLGFLAQSMQKAGTTVFNIEDIQPSWLSGNNRARLFYSLSSAFLVFILALALSPTLAAIVTFRGDILDNLLSYIALTVWLSLLFSVSFCVGLAIFAWSSSWLAVPLKGKYARALTSGGLTWLAISLFSGVFVQQIADNVSQIGIGFIMGTIFGLGASISVGLNLYSNAITPRDKIMFTQPTADRLKKYFPEFIWITIVFALVGGLTGPVFENNELNFSAFFLTFFEILPLTLLTGLLCWIGLAALDAPKIDKRHAPAEGIRASLRNGFLITLIAGALFSGTGAVMDAWYEANGLFLFMVLSTILPVAFTWYGGMTWVQHQVVKFLLARQNKLPFKLTDWLEQMASAGLLRQVGGGYIFIHRSLLEFFADSESPTKN